MDYSGTKRRVSFFRRLVRRKLQGIRASDPLPADTLFGKAARGDYDGVVALYHDQGLIPLKLVAFGTCVNLTVGLPIIRTSVDHGTAFDIVGKGVADPGSLIEAIKLAAKLRRRGVLYGQWCFNKTNRMNEAKPDRPVNRSLLMTNQSEATRDMIQRQLKDLDQIFQETMETLNTVSGAERVAKWKARTSALITESLGQKEGQKFAALQPGPSFSNDLVEEFTDLIDYFRNSTDRFGHTTRSKPLLALPAGT